MKRNLIAGVVAMVIVVTCAAFVVQNKQGKSELRAIGNKPGDELCSPLTLAAFKTAKQLRTKYDSVVWFAHVNKSSTFFYVINGKWLQYGNGRPISVADAKLSVVSQKVTEIKPSVNEVFTGVENYNMAPGDVNSKPSYQMGLVSPDLKEIIPPRYDMVYNISGTIDNLIEVEKNGKKGFYNLRGKIVVPVEYNAIYPLSNDENLAVLAIGNKYVYLKKDLQLSGKVELKLGDFFAKVKYTNGVFVADSSSIKVVTENNSRNDDRAVFISPSYMVDLKMLPFFQRYSNPMRKLSNYYKGRNLKVTYTGKAVNSEHSWLEAFFYSIQNNFLGGRIGFYNKQSVVVVDKRNDKLASFDVRENYYPDTNDHFNSSCSLNAIRAVNDSLIELKITGNHYIKLYSGALVKTTLIYNYLAYKDNKWVQLEAGKRRFPFTAYVKMDDSYIDWCFSEVKKDAKADKTKARDELMVEILQYMKNEIYAGYDFHFKDKHWNDVFYTADANGQPHIAKNTDVDRLLSAIDQYNINFINQKLKVLGTSPDLAAK